MPATYSQESLSRPFLYLLLAKQNISLLRLGKLCTTQCGFGFFHHYPLSLSFNGWHCLPSLRFKMDGLFIYLFPFEREINIKEKKKNIVTSYCCVFLLVTSNFASLFGEEGRIQDRSMQHFPVKSNLLDSDTTKFGFGGNEQPLCPKPRRLGPAIPDCLKPVRCTKHRFVSLTALSVFLITNAPFSEISFHSYYLV